MQNILMKIYEEFGIDIHSVPNALQSQLNLLVKEVIKLRKKQPKTQGWADMIEEHYKEERKRKRRDKS